VNVDVAIEGAVDLGSYAFTLTWDASELQYTSVTNGAFLSSTGRSVLCSAPQVGVSSVTFDCSSSGAPAGPNGSGVLATVQFQAIGTGNSPATLSGITLADTSSTSQAAVTTDGSIDAETGLRLRSGSYTGNGVDDQAVTGLPFQPDVVLIATEGTLAPVLRTSTMAGDASKPVGDTGALVANLVQSLTSDGFTVGTDARVNAAGTTYHWVAMDSGPDLAVGTYVGNSINNRSITGVGFQPAWVMTLGNGSDSVFRPANLAGNNSFRMNGFTPLGGRIYGVLADGFQLGGNGDVNQNGVTYHYIAFRDGLDLTAGTYTGNGNDDRAIGGVGFQPAFVWVKRANGSASAWRPGTLGGDSTLSFDLSAVATDRIQAIQSDGFQAGTHITVNGSGETYHYLALKE
jgi:hypothetical protein